MQRSANFGSSGVKGRGEVEREVAPSLKLC